MEVLSVMVESWHKSAATVEVGVEGSDVRARGQIGCLVEVQEDEGILRRRMRRVSDGRLA